MLTRWSRLLGAVPLGHSRSCILLLHSWRRSLPGDGCGG